MSKTQTSKNTNSKKAVVTFASLTAVARTRATKSADGGRYSVKTRRLVIPADFAGKKCEVKSGGGVLVVVATKDGKYSCHPDQHFVTLPSGTVVADSNLTLEKTELADLPKEAVAYKLPNA